MADTGTGTGADIIRLNNGTNSTPFEISKPGRKKESLPYPIFSSWNGQESTISQIYMPFLSNA